MKLRYTPRALAELDEILTHVGQRSPQGAKRVKARISSTAALLADHPHAGTKTSNPRLARIVVTPYPYPIFYEVAEEEVIIIEIRHGARDPASMPGAGEA